MKEYGLGWRVRVLRVNVRFDLCLEQRMIFHNFFSIVWLEYQRINSQKRHFSLLQRIKWDDSIQKLPKNRKAEETVSMKFQPVSTEFQHG
jgi:hypothetical protein